MFGRLRLLATLAGSALVGTGLIAYHPGPGSVPRAAAHLSRAPGTPTSPPSSAVIAASKPRKGAALSASSSSHTRSRASSSSAAADSSAIFVNSPHGASTPRISFAAPSAPISSPFATVPIERADFGINVFSYDQQLNSPSTISALDNLGMGLQQFPNDNEWSWTTNTFRSGSTGAVSLDRWGQILSQTGSSGLFIFNYDENPTFTGGGTPSDAAQLTQYIVQHNLPIHAIVIGSEEYGSWDYSANLNPSTSASYYAQQAALIAQAIHSVDPGMAVGVVFDPGTGATDVAWNQAVLRATAPYINFVSVHEYPVTSTVSNSELLSLLPGYIAGTMKYVKSEIALNVPPAYQSRIQVWVTEFNPYWQPSAQSTQPVYGAAMAESAILWHALGADRIVFWSYDGQAHSPTASYPVDTTPGTSYALFAIAGNGQAPELPMNQLYPSGQSLSSLMAAIGGGGSLTAWAGSNLVAGEVASGRGDHLFLINQSATQLTVGIDGKNVTIPAASYEELSESKIVTFTSAIHTASYATTTSTPSYAALPAISSAPSSMYPGETVTLSGSNFGVSQGKGYVSISENGVNYGAPGNAYTVRILRWSSNSISFEVPNGYSGPGLTAGSAASVAVGTGDGLVSSSVSITVSAPPALSVSSVSPDPISAGEWVTLYGNQFGDAQGSGYVWISQNGVNWGAPGNAYPVEIKSWTNTAITFLAPTNAYEVDGHWEAAVQGGSDATIQVVSGSGSQSSPLSVPVVTEAAATPSVTSISISGSTATINGSNFGAQPPLSTAGGGGEDQNVLEITDTRTGSNYGYTGNWYGLGVQSWTSTRIVVQFVASPPAVGDTLTFRFYEPVNGSATVVAQYSTAY